MRSYNHRDPRDLLALRDDLSTLTDLQRSILLVAAVKAGLHHPRGPVRLAFWFVFRTYGDRDGMARAAAAWNGLPKRMTKEEWNRLLTHIVSGRNTEDPTSAGGLNHRDLLMFLNGACLAGWTPPERGG
jgi:hypothetical protein